MFKELSLGAYRLDLWLRKRVGRPYMTILGVGLILAIIDNVSDVSEVVEQGLGSHVGSLVKTALIVVFHLVLLINLLAQWREHRDRPPAEEGAST